MEESNNDVTIEGLKFKIENQSRLIKELTIENEELYHQYNHLIIRNGKMLKRIDDYQKIIDDLHIRNQELQLINSNIMQLNDKLRHRGSFSISQGNSILNQGENQYERLMDIQTDHSFDIEELYKLWKNYPGQSAHNAPNLRKQVLMLVCLYKFPSLRAAELFDKSGVGGVTGARYVSTLKKFELIKFSGARKKGQYEITSKGKDFIESTFADKKDLPS
jgi:predicted transcriptional regulator